MSTSSRVSKAFSWKLMERIAVFGVQFVIQIVLARLLNPSDYSAIALIMVFIQLANIFIQTGFNSALIQAKEVDDDDYSSVFWINMALGFFFVVILFFAAPAIAAFYSRPILQPTLRVLSLLLLPGAANSVQIARFTRELNFRGLFKANFLASLLSAAAGLAAAYAGWGVWALIVQQLVNQLAVTLIMGFSVRWLPALRIRFVRVKRLFHFGSKMLLSGLMDTVYNNIYPAVVGKIFDRNILGYFNRAQSIPMIIQDTLNGAISSVLLPVMSKEQDDRSKVRHMLRRSMILSSYFVFPVMVGIAVCAEPLILLLFKEKWLPAVPYLQILCLTYLFFPMHTANLQAITAIGHSDIFLKLEVVKKLVGIISLAVTAPLGVMAMTWSKLTTGVIGSFINAFPNRSLLGYSYRAQIKDLLPNFAATAFMALCTWIAGLPLSGAGTKLLLQVATGVISYLAFSIVFKLEGYKELKGQIKGVFRR